MKYLMPILLMMAVILVSGCVTEPAANGNLGNGNPGTNPDPTPTNITSVNPPPPDHQEPLSPIHVQNDRSLNPKECSDRGLGDRVIFIYSSICPACKMTKPALMEAASELGKTVEEINLVTDVQKLDELAILPYYIPTTIIDCEIMVGAKQKFEFRDAMELM